MTSKERGLVRQLKAFALEMGAHAAKSHRDKPKAVSFHGGCKECERLIGIGWSVQKDLGLLGQGVMIPDGGYEVSP